MTWMSDNSQVDNSQQNGDETTGSRQMQQSRSRQQSQQLSQAAEVSQPLDSVHAPMSAPAPAADSPSAQAVLSEPAPRAGAVPAESGQSGQSSAVADFSTSQESEVNPQSAVSQAFHEPVADGAEPSRQTHAQTQDTQHEPVTRQQRDRWQELHQNPYVEHMTPGAPASPARTGQPYPQAPYPGAANVAAPSQYAVPTRSSSVPQAAPVPQGMAYPPVMGYPPIPQYAPVQVPMAQPYGPQYWAAPQQYPVAPQQMPYPMQQIPFPSPAAVPLQAYAGAPYGYPGQSPQPAVPVQQPAPQTQQAEWGRQPQQPQPAVPGQPHQPPQAQHPQQPQSAMPQQAQSQDRPEDAAQPVAADPEYAAESLPQSESPSQPASEVQSEAQTPSHPSPSQAQQQPQAQMPQSQMPPQTHSQMPSQPAYSAYPAYSAQPAYPAPPAYPPYFPQVFPPAQFVQMLPQQWQAWWQNKRRTQAAKHDYSIVGWALTLIIGVWMVGTFLVMVGVSLSKNSESIPNGVLLLLSNLPLYAIAMPLSLLVFRNVPRLATKRFDMSPGTFIKLFVATVPIMFIGSIIGNLVAAPFSAEDTLDSALMNTDYVSLFLLTCVCAPIFEEWIFRKEIIDRTRKYGEKTAIIVSALCFGLFHGNVRQFFYAFGLGLILGYMYVRTSKLWYSMLMHALVNLNGGTISIWVTSQIDDKALSRAMEQSADATMREVQRQLSGVIIVGVYALIMLALFVAGIVILVRNRKRFVFFDAPEQLEQGTGVKTALGNAGMIVFLVIGILMTISALVMSQIPAEGSVDVGGSGSATMLLQMVGVFLG
ncbi:type II CAAX prenyl endopeptidase Rce1 family protein [Bifidobacterium apri]|uniref:CPBP family intramembrane glutamic endopeptidase n=1 Tax=Bifidobacterium apri TaxID=1769423 RepID=UPI0039955071